MRFFSPWSSMVFRAMSTAAFVASDPPAWPAVAFQ